MQSAPRPTTTATDTFDRAALRSARPGERIGAAHRRGRRYHSYVAELGGGLFANIADERLVGVGIEPVGDVLVRLDGRIDRIGDRRHRLRLVWAAPAAAGAVAAAGVAAGLVLGRRRAA